MPVSKEEQDFVDYVLGLMFALGPVTSKRMFGGHGIFLEGLMFGIISERELYLKVDQLSLEEFESAGSLAFTYNKQGKPAKLNYYQAPEEAMDDPDVMLHWANLAYGAALRNVKK